MSIVDLAALLTSVAALLAAGAQWGWLMAPPGATGTARACPQLRRVSPSRKRHWKRATDTGPCYGAGSDGGSTNDAWRRKPKRRHPQAIDALNRHTKSTHRKEQHVVASLEKWNSRLVAVTAAGISTLATAPDVSADLRGAGIVVVATTGILMLDLRDIFGRREAMHALSTPHPPPAGPAPQASASVADENALDADIPAL